MEEIRQGHESIGIFVDTLFIYHVYCTKHFEISVAFGHHHYYYIGKFSNKPKNVRRSYEMFSASTDFVQITKLFKYFRESSS